MDKRVGPEHVSSLDRCAGRFHLRSRFVRNHQRHRGGIPEWTGPQAIRLLERLASPAELVHLVFSDHFNIALHLMPNIYSCVTQSYNRSYTRNHASQILGNLHYEWNQLLRLW